MERRRERMTWMLVDDGRVTCGAVVGANRCQLAPHDTGRHDVAPDDLWVRLEVTPADLAVAVPEEMLRHAVPDIVAQAAAEARGWRPGDQLVVALEDGQHVTGTVRDVAPDGTVTADSGWTPPPCPATERQCSCRPGERCSSAVHPAR